MQNVDFDHAPFLVIWETTQACDLACKHCRASAMPGPFPGELSTDEGKRLIEQVAGMGTPLLVLSGGDPASRNDLIELVAYAKSRNLRVATVPAATPRLTFDLVKRLKEAGLDQIAFSLDFPRAELHDAFRGVPGAFDKTLQAIQWAHHVGLPPQINTCVWDESRHYLAETVELAERLRIVFWEVFFLVPVGRGNMIRGLTPEACEQAFEILAAAQAKKKFVVKVTEAPHYRRFLAQRHEKEIGRGGPLAGKAVNAGNGFLFVSHLGEIFPSGFLPLSAGNVRKTSLATAYRDTPLFQSLRDPDRLVGRCGRCPFKTLCGGSRSRAFALTGNPLDTDPWCGYDPA